jgi:hypothetical protein
MKLIRFSSLHRHRRAAALGAALVLLGAAATIRGQSAAKVAKSSVTAVSFEPFRVIGSLNIFDAYRVGPVSEVQQPHVETITLVGTLSDDRDHLAFFDSSTLAYRKALAVGDAVAGFTVQRIETNGVDLMHDSKLVPLRMGQQLRRPPGGDWSAGDAPREIPSADAAAPAAPSVLPGDDAAALKRMIENRQKQLKQ